MLGIVCGDARSIPLPDESVQCVVTSPPYFGLRTYEGKQDLEFKDGWRGAFGREPSVEMYVSHTIEILREIHRVLRHDGIVFWNVADSYAGSWGNYGARKGQQRSRISEKYHRRGYENQGERTLPPTALISRSKRIPRGEGRWGGGNGSSPELKAKDLCLIPQRIAISSQSDGWWVRSFIIWAKGTEAEDGEYAPMSMPESVRDRPTRAWEAILMLTKSAHYFYDADAVARPASESSVKRLSQPNLENQEGSDRVPGKTNGPMKACFGGRNKHAAYGTRIQSGNEDQGRYIQNGVNLRNVWTFPTQPFKGNHVATFPEELPRRCIKAGSKVGDLILDPFGGSGTTGRVAIELNRCAVLLDLAYADKDGVGEYATLARKRTTGVQRQIF